MIQPILELSQVAPTLADLKNLPQELKDRLFLSRLAKMSGHDPNVLNKSNLNLPNDPYGLANGYPLQERRQVIEHLLGAPWIRLVNAGYLVDLNGQGFHKVSSDGHEFLNQPTNTTAPITVPSRIAYLPARIAAAPRVFISYSWDSDVHKAWVLELAKRLVKDGIDIILDRWHLKPGFDKPYFMEQAVAQSDFLVIVCTENYATKANSRAGGVGYESLIITGEVARDALTDKFIPVLRHGSFENSLPLYLGSRLGVDMRGDPYSEDSYEELIRQLHGEPIVAPPIGKKPDFSSGSWKLTSGRPIVAVEMEGALPTIPLEQKPNASVWARYDKPGEADAWISGIIRVWDQNRYSFEIVKGNDIEAEDFFKTKSEVIARFNQFNQSTIQSGYKRMQFTPGPDPDFRVIP